MSPFIEGHVVSEIIKATDLGYVTSSKCSFLCYEVLLHLVAIVITFTVSFFITFTVKKLLHLRLMLHLLAIVITFTVITLAGVITFTGDTTQHLEDVLNAYLAIKILKVIRHRV